MSANSTFDEHIPTALAATQANLGTTDYKVVKFDEFVGALKTAVNFQDDFEYKSTLWGLDPSGLRLAGRQEYILLISRLPLMEQANQWILIG